MRHENQLAPVLAAAGHWRLRLRDLGWCRLQVGTEMLHTNGPDGDDVGDGDVCGVRVINN